MTMAEIDPINTIELLLKTMEPSVPVIFIIVVSSEISYIYSEMSFYMYVPMVWPIWGVLVLL